MECWEKYNKLLMPLPYKNRMDRTSGSCIESGAVEKNRKK